MICLARSWMATDAASVAPLPGVVSLVRTLLVGPSIEFMADFKPWKTSGNDFPKVSVLVANASISIG